MDAHILATATKGYTHRFEGALSRCEYECLLGDLRHSLIRSEPRQRLHKRTATGITYKSAMDEMIDDRGIESQRSLVWGDTHGLSSYRNRNLDNVPLDSSTQGDGIIQRSGNQMELLLDR